MIKEYRNQAMVDKIDLIANSILSEKNSNHHRDKFFPELIKKMDLKTGAEIGVDKGQFSHHILSKTNIQKFYCIDCWMDDFGSDHRKDAYDPIGENRMNEAIDKLNEFKDRTVFIKKSSADACECIDDGALDFCYIDGDHSLTGIYTDIHCWIHKVKTGGIIAGHDFKDGKDSGIKDYWGDQLPYLIETVVRNFCNQYGFKLNVVGGQVLSWWFVKTI